MLLKSNKFINIVIGTKSPHFSYGSKSVLPCIAKCLKNHAINLTESNQNVYLKERFRYADHVVCRTIFFYDFQWQKKKNMLKNKI